MTLEKLINELQKIDESNKDLEVSVTSKNVFGAINADSDKLVITVANGKLNLSFIEESK